MIWQIARVVAGPGGLVLEFSSPDACERCNRGEGCGAGLFSGLVLRGRSRMELSGHRELANGEWVRVGLPTDRLAVAGVLFYGLPLLGFLLGALALHLLLGPVAWRDIGALGGGLTALAVVAFVLRQGTMRGLDPVIERLSCSDGATISIDRI